MATKHLRQSGRLFVEVTVDRKRDVYRGDLFWYEGSGGEIVPYRTAIVHHLVKTVPIASVLVAFTDVRNPAAPDKVDAAAGVLMKMGPYDLTEGRSGPSGRLHVERIASVPSAPAARGVRSAVDEDAAHELDL